MMSNASLLSTSIELIVSKVCVQVLDMPALTPISRTFLMVALTVALRLTMVLAENELSMELVAPSNWLEP